MKKTNWVALCIAGCVAFGSMTLTGCNKSDTDRANDDINRSADKAKDGLKDASVKTKDALKNAGEKTGDALKKAGDKLKEASATNK
jgi:hypothetical protein